MDQYCGGDVIQREAEIAGNRTLLRRLPTLFATCDQFADVSVNCWDILEIADLAIVLKLGYIVRAKLISFAQRTRRPIRIEVYQRREGSLREPARLDGPVWLAQNR